MNITDNGNCSKESGKHSYPNYLQLEGKPFPQPETLAGNSLVEADGVWERLPQNTVPSVQKDIWDTLSCRNLGK